MAKAHAGSDATNVKISRDTERWELEISAEIPAEALAKYRAAALREVTAEAKIDGFRPGKAPETIVLQHYGEGALLQHAAEHAVKHEIPEILAKEKANIVDSPKVSIETLAPGQPLKFTARAPLAPEVKLGDYKKIAAKRNAEKTEVTVTDDEHKDTLSHLKRERTRISHLEAGKSSEEAAAEAAKLEEKNLPPLDEEFVKSLGYESEATFVEVVRNNIKTEKEMRETEKRRAALLDELAKSSDIKYPAVLKEYELEDMASRMNSDLERMGTTLEKYLEATKKTLEDMRKEWDKPADERAKVRLVLAEIARAEKLEPDAKKLAAELEHAKKSHPQAHPEALRAHITHALRNEAVITWLEELK
jgi:trigger factor